MKAKSKAIEKVIEYNSRRAGKIFKMLNEYIRQVKNKKTAIIFGKDYVVMDKKTFENYEQALTEQRDELKGKIEAIFTRLWECDKCNIDNIGIDCNKMSCGKELKLISKVFEEVK